MMILYFLLFIGIIFIPILLSLWKRISIEKETYDETYEFYQNQLHELKRDYHAKLINSDDYNNARIEVQRRLLQSDISPNINEEPHFKSHNIIIFCVLTVIPLFATILYSIHGVPFFDSESASKQQKTQIQTPLLILKKLEAEIENIDPTSPDYIPKNQLLGRLEVQMGMMDQAIFHFTRALKIHFTPELALDLAEAQTKKDGYISAHALTLYHQALNAAPPNAPWRLTVEERIAAGEHEQDQNQKTPITPSQEDAK